KPAVLTNVVVHPEGVAQPRGRVMAGLGQARGQDAVVSTRTTGTGGTREGCHLVQPPAGAMQVTTAQRDDAEHALGEHGVRATVLLMERCREVPYELRSRHCQAFPSRGVCERAAGPAEPVPRPGPPG